MGSPNNDHSETGLQSPGMYTCDGTVALRFHPQSARPVDRFEGRERNGQKPVRALNGGQQQELLAFETLVVGLRADAEVRENRIKSDAANTVAVKAANGRVD